MQDVNPNAWGSWKHEMTNTSDAQSPMEEPRGAYDMYPQSYRGDTRDTAPLTLRASKEEAAFKGWALSDADIADATRVAVADRVRWESSTQPAGAMMTACSVELQDGVQ